MRSLMGLGAIAALCVAIFFGCGEKGGLNLAGPQPAGLGMAGLAKAVVPVTPPPPVERPFKIDGDVTVTLYPSYYASATGNATHVGKYTSYAAVQGKGICTAANGDQLFWDEWTVGPWTYPAPDKVTFTMMFKITGGTGRFEGASGSFGPATTTATFNDTYTGVTFSYSATGTILY
jgi:hypothetical protein